MRAASVPGAGGLSARTPLMANLVGKLDTSVTPGTALGAAAGSNGAGLAPVGAGGGPTGMMGQNGKSGGSRPGLLAPSPLAYDLGEDEDDDW